MKHLKSFTALLIGLLCSLSPMAYGHSGGTNEVGCHNERSTGGYHCHDKDDDDDKWEEILLWTVGGLIVLVIAKQAWDEYERKNSSNVNSIRPEFRLTDQDTMGGLSWSHGALSANGLTDGEKLEGTIQLEFPISR